METERRVYPMIKRCMDICGALAGLVLLLPLGLIIALLIKASDGGPAFFRQTRVGRHGEPFSILKFRSMRVASDKIGLPVTNGADARITSIGRILRQTKLDELPQLWNVLAGDMSLVGPRPEVPRYVEQYTPRQCEILRYRPGITDLASLLFRDEEALLSGAQDVEQFYVSHCLPKKLELNRQYARRATPLGDVWIILQTICPAWLGVSALYGVTLAACWWLTCELRYDFHLASGERADCIRSLPWIIGSQLVALGIWGQLRSALSYFSILEARRTAAAVLTALLFNLGLRQVSSVSASTSIALIDAFLTLSVLCAMRIALRTARERRRSHVSLHDAKMHRVAIVGSGEAATRMALNLKLSRNGEKRVVAFFDDNPRRWHKRPHNIPVVGMPECLLNSEWRQRIDEIVIEPSEIESDRLQEIVALLKPLPWKIALA